MLKIPVHGRMSEINGQVHGETVARSDLGPLLTIFYAYGTLEVNELLRGLEFLDTSGFEQVNERLG